MAWSFIDDSGSGGDSRYFVLAGYVAPESIWQTFVRQWQEVLEREPRISYFKMNEAAQCCGQFTDFSAESRDQKVAELIEVILSHRMWEASVVIPGAEFSEILAPHLPDQHCSPYYFAFIGMTVALSAYYRWAKVQERVEFIFDRQEGKEHRAARFYHHFISYFDASQMGGVRFGDDKMLPPLQAADLIAWQTRRWLCSTGSGCRPELQKLHERREWWYRFTAKRRDLEDMRDAIINNLPDLRAECGDDRVDGLLKKIAIHNDRRAKKLRKT